MDWTLFFILMSAWIIFMVFAMLFFQGASMKGKKYEEEFLKTKDESNNDIEAFEYRKHLHEYIIKLRDKDNIEEFYSLGNVKYISGILNIIGFECTVQVARLLESHPNVVSIQEATEGELFNLDKVAGGEYVNHV